MKTQVIPIEAHDDVVSLRDKLSWVKARRVVLVASRQSAAIDTRLAWLLLRRRAEAMGAGLAVVTHSMRIRRLAQEAGIPVFTTVLEAQRRDWPARPSSRFERRSPLPNLDDLRGATRRPEAHWRTSLGARLAFFSLAVFALLALLLFLLPSAEIQLFPEVISQSLTLRVRAVPEATQTEYLPLKQASVIVEGEKFWPSSGQVSLPLAAAQGQVRFRNLTDAVIGIPAGTIVQTDDVPPVRFFTLSDAVVAAGVGSWVDVPVQAEHPGARGNLPADSLVVVPGPLGASLSATNPQATSGGRDRLATAPSPQDRQRARMDLLRELRQRAQELLQQQAGADSILLPGMLTLVETLEETSLPPEGQAGDALFLRLRVEFQGYFLDGNDVRRWAEMALDSSLPVGFVPLRESLSVQLTATTEMDEMGVVTCSLLLRRNLKRQQDTLHLARLVRGRRPAEASSLLATQLALESPPRVRLRPSWWPWLPFTEFRIAIKEGD